MIESRSRPSTSRSNTCKKHNEPISEHFACAETDINLANQQAQLSFERVTRRKRIREAEEEMQPSAKRMR
jgi:hypothetical protein